MELKFRGWDTIKKMMYSADEMGADQLTLSTDGRGFVNVSGSDMRFSTFMHHITPIQFTGKYDKDHTEIYKGDIVQGKDGKRMLVGWRDTFASFVLDSEGWMFSHWFGESYESEDCKVIGNKYQNPEMLVDEHN